MAENGWLVQGIDISRIMVDQCRKLGLPAVEGDAIGYLRTLEENSVAVVSGFHIAEHLPHEVLLTLFEEAQRVLLPGGVLILETPNPENILVKSCTFYLDPSHRKPLPPELLQFMAEDVGFLSVAIMRLNGPDPPEDDASLAWQAHWALNAHPDYSLLAQKSSVPGVCPVNDCIDRLKHTKVDSLTSLNKILDRFEGKYRTLEERHLHLVMEYNAMMASLSWRITAPLRWVNLCLRRIGERLSLKKLEKKLILHLSRFLEKHPGLTRTLLKLIDSSPLAKKSLKRIVLKVDRMVSGSPSRQSFHELSPHAAQIYSDLKRALNRD
ncbi:MAG: class I SAM-dependent methyltransferase [Syntrophotaleaceae bacterium]